MRIHFPRPYGLALGNPQTFAGQSPLASWSLYFCQRVYQQESIPKKKTRAVRSRAGHEAARARRRGAAHHRCCHRATGGCGGGRLSFMFAHTGVCVCVKLGETPEGWRSLRPEGPEEQAEKVPSNLAMVQNQWCHFGIGAPPISV